jgi:hypothetical protein
MVEGCAHHALAQLILLARVGYGKPMLELVFYVQFYIYDTPDDVVDCQFV